MYLKTIFIMHLKKIQRTSKESSVFILKKVQHEKPMKPVKKNIEKDKRNKTVWNITKTRQYQWKVPRTGANVRKTVRLRAKWPAYLTARLVHDRLSKIEGRGDRTQSRSR